MTDADSVTDSGLAPVLAAPSPGAVRGELLSLLVADIHGPVDVPGVEPSTEEIEDAPSERYVLGCPNGPGVQAVIKMWLAERLDAASRLSARR